MIYSILKIKKLMDEHEHEQLKMKSSRVELQKAVHADIENGKKSLSAKRATFEQKYSRYF